MILKVDPVIDRQISANCLKPYHGHPGGCPNYGRKKGCPPGAPLFSDFMDLTKPVYAIINVIPLHAGSDAFSSHALEKKSFKEEITSFLREHRGYHVTTCPEAMGVDITKTLAGAGFKLEWPPQNYVCQVALAGLRNIKEIKSKS
ncbi:hypothetical protein [Pelotomaculum propionicicum]|uniref:DUF2284 domain-containing protein n=1 Tax=Pelotomaculum propionicicum TaxID=258475 RepID=A0A4Y7RNQ7_9FIRM|nr:hypothetical protein [Pelotomaculum propionicicum]NLI13492.1 hypothetical protein [Peptococcaceae bacterium]TEB10624.1 hypothetical protein Pmgp_02204 [Pelotomaculum propionicicum]